MNYGIQHYEIKPDDRIYVGLTGMIALSKAAYRTLAALGMHDRHDEAKSIVRFIDDKLFSLDMDEAQKGVMASLAMMAGAGSEAYQLFTQMLKREGSIDGPTRFFAEEIISRAAVNQLPRDSYAGGVLKAYMTGQPMHALDVSRFRQPGIESHFKPCYVYDAPKTLQ